MTKSDPFGQYTVDEPKTTLGHYAWEGIKKEPTPARRVHFVPPVTTEFEDIPAPTPPQPRRPRTKFRLIDPDEYGPRAPKGSKRTAPESGEEEMPPPVHWLLGHNPLRPLLGVA